MKSKSVIIKSKCNQNQDGNPIKLQQYTILEDNGVRFLVLEFKNEYKSRLNDATFIINETLIGGNLEKEHTIKHIDIDPDGIFVSNKIRVQNDCKNISFHLISATFENVIYSNGIFTKIDKKFKNRFLNTKINKQKFSLSVLLVSLPVILVTTLLTYFGVKQYAYSKPVFNIEDFDYRFEDEDDMNETSPIVITNYHGDDRNIKIPSQIKKHKIITIDSDAFKDNKTIESIEFDSDIYLNDRVFYDCTSLKSIDFDNITSFGTYCFSGTAIESFSTDRNIAIADYAFYNCYNLSNVDITSQQIILGKRSFSNCDNLRHFSIDSEYELDDYNLDFIYDCPQIEELHLTTLNRKNNDVPLTINNLLGEENSKKLEKLNIENISYIPKDFANGLYKLQSVTIDNMKYPKILDGAFNCSTKLQSLIIPNVDYVGKEAFCLTSISNFNFSNVKFIGDNAFEGTELKSIDLKQCDSIGKEAFKGCFLLDKVELSDELASLSDNLFENCKSLKSVNIPNNTKTIGAGVFKDCINLSSLTCNNPYLIESIGANAFNSCASLNNIDLDKFINLNNIGEYAFSGCKAISEIDLSNTKITSLPFGLIKGCELIQRVYFPETVTELPDHFFNGCKKLNSLSLKGIKVIGDYAFKGCINLEYVSFDPNLESIGKYAFDNCESLKSLSIPQNTITIGSNLLNNCYSLTDLSIPFIGKDRNNISTMNYLFGNELHKSKLESVEILDAPVIENNTFNGLHFINSLSIAGNTSYIKPDALVDFNDLKNLTVPFIGSSKENSTTLLKMLGGNFTAIKDLQTLKVTNATKIADDALYNLENLKELYLNDEIEDIGSNAFSYCTSLKNVHLPRNLKVIQNGLFSNCYSLEQVDIPDGVTKVSYGAFESCEALTSIEFPDSVVEFGESILYNCPKLLKLKTPFIGSDINNESSYSYFNNYSDYNLVSVELTKSTTVADFAFEGFTQLHDVILNEGITKIGMNAFNSNESLEYIDIPSTVEIIDNNAFEYCSNLQEINLPDALNYIGNSALAYCSSLETVILPDSLEYIGYSVLFHCDKLKDLTMPFIGNSIDTSDSLNSFTSNSFIIEKVTVTKANKIAPNCFFSFQSLSEVTLNEGIKYIGANAFDSCILLTSVTIPQTVENIGDYAFKNCSSLKSFIIPDSIKSIGKTILADDNSIEYYKAPFIGADRNLANRSMRDIFGYMYLNEIESNLTIEITNEKTVPDYSFQEMYNLSKVILNEGITKIGKYSFTRCYKLKDINFPSTLKDIENCAFESCYSIEELNFNEGLERCSNCLIDNCSLMKITLPSTLVKFELGYLGFNALYEINNYSKIDLTSSYDLNLKIQQGHINLRTKDSDPYKETYVNNGLTFIERDNEALLINSTNEMKDVIIPDTVTIGGKVFDKININSCCFKADNNIESVVFSKAVSSVSRSCFQDALNLKKVDFGEDSQITNIESEGFRNCISLKEITIPNSVLGIGSYAFAYDYGLECITIGENVGFIDHEAFRECNNLFEIYNLSKLVIDKTYDNGGIGLRALVVHDSLNDEPFVKTKIDNFYFGAYKDKCYLLKYESNLNEDLISLPESVEINDKIYKNYTIAPKAFTHINSNCLYIPNAVNEIMNEAFYNSYLTQIVFEENSQIKNIGSYTFSMNYNLTDIVLPNSIVTIGDHAFEGCDQLKSIVLGENVESIGIDVFESCKSLCLVINLSKLDIQKGSTDFGGVAKNAIEVTKDPTARIFTTSIDEYGVNIIGSSLIVTSVPYPQDYKLVFPDNFVYEEMKFDKYYLKSGCLNYQVHEIVIPSSVLDIPDDFIPFNSRSICKITIMPNPSFTKIKKNAFDSLNNLSEIVIPEGIVEIESNAFYNCGLERVSLPSTLKKIGYDAFGGANNITELVNYSSLVFTPGDSSDGTGLSRNLVTITDKPFDEKVLKYYSNAIYELVNDNYYYKGCTNYLDDTFAFPKGIYNWDELIKETYSIDLICNHDYIFLSKLYIPKQVINISDGTFKCLPNECEICYEGTEEEFAKIVKDVGSIKQNIRYQVEWTIENGHVVEVIKNA